MCEVKIPYGIWIIDDEKSYWEPNHNLNMLPEAQMELNENNGYDCKTVYHKYERPE